MGGKASRKKPSARWVADLLLFRLQLLHELGQALHGVVGAPLHAGRHHAIAVGHRLVDRLHGQPRSVFSAWFEGRRLQQYVARNGPRIRRSARSAPTGRRRARTARRTPASARPPPVRAQITFLDLLQEFVHALEALPPVAPVVPHPIRYAGSLAGWDRRGPRTCRNAQWRPCRLEALRLKDSLPIRVKTRLSRRRIG